MWRYVSMKKILIISLALILSSTAFAQKKKCRALRKMDEKMNELYRSHCFRSSFLVLSPKVYNPDNDTTISHIEFLQDFTTEYIPARKTFASIDPGQSINKNYIIGLIGLFQSQEYAVNVIIRKVYKNGQESIENRTIHFDDLMPEEGDTESAAYGIGNGVIEFSDDGKLVWS